MYKFIDVNEASEEKVLPSEAMQINGVYIENMISGYRTLNVSGREALSPELNYFETGVKDGSTLQSKRFPARTITVTYQIVAADGEAFRTAYNQLGEILNVEHAKLVFNDEPDKYFVGTPEYINDVDPGRNAVVGSFDILCVDPFKYSVQEYTADASLDKDSIIINYNGTYKSHPTLVAKFYEESEPATISGNGDCGYVAFFTEDKKIIQLGDPAEVDGESNGYPASQALLNQVFKTADAWGTAAKSLWGLNYGQFDYVENGTLGMKKMSDGVNYFLTPVNYGENSGGWHGASMTRVIPADKSGDLTNNVFDLYFKPVFEIGTGASAVRTYGEFSLVLLSADNEKIAKIRLCKNSDGKAAALRFYVGSECIYKGSVDVSPGNKHFGSCLNNPNCRISKTATGFVFVMGGVTKSFKMSNVPNITKFEMMFSQYQSRGMVAYNGLLWVKVTKHYCNTFKEIPNKFMPNDVLECDCRSGEIRLNKALAPELGALGNDWESFVLTPGLNQIGFSYSDWITDAYAPKLSLRYREVFL